MDMTKIKLSKILTVAALSAATAVSTLPVSAKTVQTGGYEITSSGTINAKANEEVTMDVYHIGKSQADLTAGLTSDELMKIVLRRDQITADMNLSLRLGIFKAVNIQCISPVPTSAVRRGLLKKPLHIVTLMIIKRQSVLLTMPHQSRT